MGDNGLDPKGLETAMEHARPWMVGMLEDERRHTTAGILAAYFGAVEPVGWVVEDGLSGFFGAPDYATRYRDVYAKGSRIRALYPGPIQEASDG